MGIVPRKHILDNEVSNAMKVLITDTYKMSYELVPPGCHRRNAAEVAIRNFKVYFLWRRAGFPHEALGQTPPTSQNYYQLTLPIQRHAHSVCLRTLEWAFRLQQHAFGTHGLTSAGTRKD